MTFYDMVKGRIAETLIEELFLAMGYSVFRYGMENTIPEAAKLLRGIRTDVAANIRTMPDFVVYKDGKVNFVEVKYRKDERFTIKDDLPGEYPYKNCYFIVVSKKHIKCITYDELLEGKEISPNSTNYLSKRKEFDLNKNMIIDMCEYAEKVFRNV